MKNDHAILLLCATLKASPSGYYDWQKRRATPGPRALESQILAEEIKMIHGRSRETYGSPRVTEALRKKGHRHGRNRIARLMQDAGLRGRQKAATASKRPTATTTSPSPLIAWPKPPSPLLPIKSG